MARKRFFRNYFRKKCHVCGQRLPRKAFTESQLKKTECMCKGCASQNNDTATDDIANVVSRNNEPTEAIPILEAGIRNEPHKDRSNACEESPSQMKTVIELETKKLSKNGEKEELKATRGEASGDHEEGHKSIMPADDENHGWEVIIKSSCEKHFNFNAAVTTTIRRNVTLDDNNQRYQLSLAIKDISYFKGILNMQIILLGMEEDEVKNSGGFPAIVIDNGYDTKLVRHEDSSYVDLSCKIVNDHIYNNNNEKKPIHLDRRRIGCNGYGWCFQRNLNEFYDCKDATVELTFHHVDTGAKMKLRLPPDDDINKNDYGDNNGNQDVESNADHNSNRLKSINDPPTLDGKKDEISIALSQSTTSPSNHQKYLNLMMVYKIEDKKVKTHNTSNDSNEFVNDINKNDHDMRTARNNNNLESNPNTTTPYKQEKEIITTTTPNKSSLSTSNRKRNMPSNERTTREEKDNIHYNEITEILSDGGRGKRDKKQTEFFLKPISSFHKVKQKEECKGHGKKIIIDNNDNDSNSKNLKSKSISPSLNVNNDILEEEVTRKDNKEDNDKYNRKDDIITDEIKDEKYKQNIINKCTIPRERIGNIKNSFQILTKETKKNIIFWVLPILLPNIKLLPDDSSINSLPKSLLFLNHQEQKDQSNDLLQNYLDHSSTLSTIQNDYSSEYLTSSYHIEHDISIMQSIIKVKLVTMDQQQQEYNNIINFCKDTLDSWIIDATTYLNQKEKVSSSNDMNNSIDIDIMKNMCAFWCIYINLLYYIEYHHGEVCNNDEQYDHPSVTNEQEIFIKPIDGAISRISSAIQQCDYIKNISFIWILKSRYTIRKAIYQILYPKQHHHNKDDNTIIFLSCILHECKQSCKTGLKHINKIISTFDKNMQQKQVLMKQKQLLINEINELTYQWEKSMITINEKNIKIKNSSMIYYNNYNNKIGIMIHRDNKDSNCKKNLIIHDDCNDSNNGQKYQEQSIKTEEDRNSVKYFDKEVIIDVLDYILEIHIVEDNDLLLASSSSITISTSTAIAPSSNTTASSYLPSSSLIKNEIKKPQKKQLPQEHIFQDIPADKQLEDPIWRYYKRSLTCDPKKRRYVVKCSLCSSTMDGRLQKMELHLMKECHNMTNDVRHDVQSIIEKASLKKRRPKKNEVTTRSNSTSYKKIKTNTNTHLTTNILNNVLNSQLWDSNKIKKNNNKLFILKYSNVSHMPYFIGQIGIRCIFCKHCQIPTSTIYPKSIKHFSIAQSILLNIHIRQCAFIPDDIKERCNSLLNSNNDNNSYNTTSYDKDIQQYWTNIANDMNMINKPDFGIKFKCQSLRAGLQIT